MNINEGKISHKINVEQRYKDDEWLERQVSRHRIHARDKIFICKIREILTSIYGDNFDIQFKIEIDRGIIKLKKMYTIIHYPETTVTNGTDSITIKNLFARATFILSCTMTGHIKMKTDIEGTRTSCTYLEYMNNYKHSHLSASYSYRDCMGKFKNFCTGTSTINAIMLYVNETLARASSMHDYNLIRMFYYQLNSFVKWQSDDGVPHIKINMVTFNEYYGEGSLPDVNYIVGICTDGRENLFTEYLGTKTDGYNTSLNYIISGENVMVKDDDKLDKFIERKFNNDRYSTIIQQYFYAYYDPSMRLYYRLKNIDNVSTRLLSSELEPFLFRGEIIPYKVEELTQEQREQYQETITNLKKVYVKPFKQYIQQQLQDILKKRIFKEYITRR